MKYITLLSNVVFINGVYGASLWQSNTRQASITVGTCQDAIEAERLGFLNAVEYLKTIDLTDTFVLFRCRNSNALNRPIQAALAELTTQYRLEEYRIGTPINRNPDFYVRKIIKAMDVYAKDVLGLVDWREPHPYE